MKALIVKDDGLIYVAEVPEEKPLMDISGSEAYPQMVYDAEMEEYEEALASAKENAVLCADQEKARKILLEYHGDGNLLQRFEGIYPIPDLQYEVNYVPIERDAATYSHYEREAEKQLVTEFKKLAVLL